MSDQTACRHDTLAHNGFAHFHSGRPGVKLREWSQRWLDNARRSLSALGFLGMFGFLGASMDVTWGTLDGAPYLAAVALSLSVFAFAMLVGHLGEQAPMRRRVASAPRLIVRATRSVSVGVAEPRRRWPQPTV